MLRASNRGTSSTITISIEADLATTTEVGYPQPSDVNNIVAITLGTTTIVETATAHGYTVNRTAAFANIEGTTELNRTSGTVTEIISTTQFRVDIDSSAYTAYTSGGQTFRLISVDGVDIYDGAVVLMVVQTHDLIENGVYIYSWDDNTWYRHPLMNTGDVITSPYYVSVRDGDDNADSVYSLQETSFLVGSQENHWELADGAGIYRANYFLAGPNQANARPNIARVRTFTSQDLPLIAVAGAESGWAKMSNVQLLQKAPRLSMLWKHANPWIEQDAFELAQTLWKEFVVDCDVGFTSAPTFYSGRRIIFEGTGFSGPVRVLSLTRNLKVFNVAGTTDLWLDGHIVGDAVITGSGTNTPLIYADATFTNLRIGDVSAKGFTHAVRFNTSHSGFEIASVRVNDTATETGFVSLISTGSEKAWLGKNHAIAQFQAIATDANATLKVHSNSPNIDFTGVLTADRTMTLSTENVCRDSTLNIRVTGAHTKAVILGSLGSIYSGSAATIAWDGVAGAWKMLSASGTSSTTGGPASSTDNAIVLWNGTTGTLLKDSTVIMGTGVGTFLATPSSANLAAALTDETGTGAAVFAQSAVLVTPALGTPQSATLTNATGLPISTGVSGLGTNVATALGITLGTGNGLAGLNVSGQTFLKPQTFNVTDASAAALTLIQQGAGPFFSVQTNAGANGLQIDGSLNVYLGTVTSPILLPGISTAAKFQQFGSTQDSATHAFVSWSSTTTQAPAIQFGKSRGSHPTNTIVTSGGLLGTIGWSGADGTGFIPAAEIISEVDGTPGTNDMPGRIVLKTTADGAATTTERLRVDNAGNVIVNTAALAGSATGGFLYVPFVTTAPTGVPTAYTGRGPITYDSANNVPYVYNSAWVGMATVTGSQTLSNKTLLTAALGTPASGNLINATGYTVTNVAGLGTNVLAFLSTPTSANLAAALTDETGSGANVFSVTPTITSPTLVTPILGTPTSGNLVNATGYTITNTAGLGANVLAFLSTPTSANLAAALTDETGSGAAVFAVTASLTSPTLVTPTLGVATATSINKVQITTPATSAVLTIANAKTLTVNNTLTLAGTDSTTQTFPATSQTIAGLAVSGQTFTTAQNFTITDNTNPGIAIVQAGSAPAIVAGQASTVATFNGGQSILAQFNALVTTQAAPAFGHWGNNTTFPVMRFFKARSNTIGTFTTAIATTHNLGRLQFEGSDGVQAQIGAQQTVTPVSTWNITNSPAKFTWATTPSNSTTPTDKLTLDETGKLLAIAATGGIGYGTGAGGVTTQLTNKSTGVVLNAPTGQVTCNSAALSAATSVSFTITNSTVAATDIVMLNHGSGGTAGSYTLTATPGSGIVTVTVRNISGATLSEAIVIQFAVFKGATS